MSTQKGVLEPYLFFEGRCEEALEFYKQALGAEIVMLMRYGDAPDPAAARGIPPNKIMHATLRIAGNHIMASDGHCAQPMNFQGFALSLAVPTEAEAGRYFNALAQGGRVAMPLGKTFWSPCFGMVIDPFGIMWMVTTVTAQNA